MVIQSQVDQRVSIETSGYVLFCSKYKRGHFGKKPMGRAFVDHFKLDKLGFGTNSQLTHMTGQSAQQEIFSLVEFV